MKRRTIILFSVLPLLFCMACSAPAPKDGYEQMKQLDGSLTAVPAEDAYRTAYEIFVYSFCDSNGDGIGDLPGVRSRLDYVCQEMGFNEIWLMPVCPSPSYHKYNVQDYMAIDPQYGTMEDFDALLSDCHARNVRVITDLVLNHTSTEHPWFKAAAEYLLGLSDGQQPSVEDCPYLDYYFFSREGGSGYSQLYDSGWFYESRFSWDMPDLNLDSEAVRSEIREILSFWLNRGVDGFRLDAVTSYYTGSSEHNIAFLAWLKETAASIQPDAYFVAEAWTDQNEYASYYASGIDSFFDFAFADKNGLIASLVSGRIPASAYASRMEAEEALYRSYHPQAINAPFYTNHDMGRSAGYYPGDDGTKVKLAGALNLLMSGNAFVYYGEEIGMKGAGKDENKRLGMIWEADPAATGICKGPDGAEPQENKFGSVAEQREDPASILTWFRWAIAIRNAFPVISHGTTAAVETLSSDTVSVFTRTADGYDPVCIAVNLGSEPVSIDLGSLDYRTLAAVLNTSAEIITLDGTALKLPAGSIAVLTQ